MWLTLIMLFMEAGTDMTDTVFLSGSARSGKHRSVGRRALVLVTGGVRPTRDLVASLGSLVPSCLQVDGGCPWLASVFGNGQVGARWRRRRNWRRPSAFPPDAFRWDVAEAAVPSGSLSLKSQA